MPLSYTDLANKDSEVLVLQDQLLYKMRRLIRRLQMSDSCRMNVIGEIKLAVSFS